MKKNCSILFLIFIFAGNVFSQNVIATAKLDSNKILVGDQVKLKVQVTYPTKTAITWPLLNDSLTSKIEIVEKSKIDTVSKDANKLTLSQSYTITSFDSGGFYVPQISFKYKDPGDTSYFEALTDSLLLNVNTIPVDTSKAIRDIKGPMSVPWTFMEMLPYIIGAILLAAIIWFILLYLKKRKKGESILGFTKPKIPAHEKALFALEALKNKKLWQNNRIKQYYTELTEITRTYIENRYSVLAMEMTTDQITSSLKSFNIEDSLIKKLREMLVLADLVKFAKANPLPDEHDRCLDTAFEFVRTTKLEEVNVDIPDEQIDTENKLKDSTKLEDKNHVD